MFEIISAIVAAIFVGYIFYRAIKSNARFATIPGDGFHPAIPQDGMPMPNFMPPTERKTGNNSFERLGADGKWHSVSDVREGHFPNGSAHVTNERGNPQRVSRRCLRCS